MTRRTLTFPPRKILVALDLTPASEPAWRSAKSLGAAFGAHVHGLYVREALTCPEPLPRSYAASVLADVRARVNAAAHEVSMIVGVPGPAIVHYADREGFDLIVMGTHGRRGFSRAFHGSVAEDVVRDATVPVLVVRRALGGIAEVLAPVNFQPYARWGLECARDVAEAFGARLTALHVVDAPLYGDAGALRGARRLLSGLADETARRGSKRPRVQIEVGEPAERIAAAAGPDKLVVLVTHRRGLLADALGTTSERALRRGGGPVLALPASILERAAALPLRQPAHAGQTGSGLSRWHAAST